MTVKVLAFSLYMSWSGQYSWQVIMDSYLGILPLLLFPEGLLNGMLITVLVIFRPEWMRTYLDRDYINNK